tara:strand:+ start:278 stop:724 length:447 start_codon:yes stop_codon:yes gene_type:complete
MKKYLIIIIYLLASCGYQPIYINKNDSKMLFQSVQLFGDKIINRKILSALEIEEDKENTSLNNLIIESKEIITETSKDSKGRVKTFRTIIETKFTVKNDDKIVSEKVFNRNFSYNNKDNKFELSEYQEEIKKSLVNEIIKELIIHINL